MNCILKLDAEANRILAHHCVGNHPARRIMKDFYHREGMVDIDRICDHALPSILGLTASPVIRAQPGELK